MGAAITVLAASVYFHDPAADFMDAVYLGGAQFLAMGVWTVFVVMLVFVTGERFRRGRLQVTLDEVELGRALRARDTKRRAKPKISY